MISLPMSEVSEGVLYLLLEYCEFCVDYRV